MHEKIGRQESYHNDRTQTGRKTVDNLHGDPSFQLVLRIEQCNGRLNEWGRVGNTESAREKRTRRWLKDNIEEGSA